MQNARYQKTKIQFSLIWPIAFILILALASINASPELKSIVTHAISSVFNQADNTMESMMFKASSEN